MAFDFGPFDAHPPAGGLFADTSLDIAASTLPESSLAPVPGGRSIFDKTVRIPVYSADGATITAPAITLAVPSVGTVGAEAIALPSSFRYNDAALAIPRAQASSCPADWAYAMAAMASSRWRLYTGETQAFSVAQLLCRGPGSGACTGHLLRALEEYVARGIFHGDLDTANPLEDPPGDGTANPLVAQGVGCTLTTRADASRTPVLPGSAVVVGGEAPPTGPFHIARHVRDFKAEIFVNGPIVARMAAHSDLRAYAGGVYRTPNVGFPPQEHLALLVVGWHHPNGEGDTSAVDHFEGAYWICRSSWPMSWPHKVAPDVPGMPTGAVYVAMGANTGDIERYGYALIPHDQGDGSVASYAARRNGFHNLMRSRSVGGRRTGSPKRERGEKTLTVTAFVIVGVIVALVVYKLW